MKNIEIQKNHLQNQSNLDFSAFIWEILEKKSTKKHPN